MRIETESVKRYSPFVRLDPCHVAALEEDRAVLARALEVPDVDTKANIAKDECRCNGKTFLNLSYFTEVEVSYRR